MTSLIITMDFVLTEAHRNYDISLYYTVQMCCQKNEKLFAQQFSSF